MSSKPIEIPKKATEHKQIYINPLYTFILTAEEKEALKWFRMTNSYIVNDFDDSISIYR